MRCAASASERIVPLVRPASSTAWAAICVDCATWRAHRGGKDAEQQAERGENLLRPRGRRDRPVGRRLGRRHLGIEGFLHLDVERLERAQLDQQHLVVKLVRLDHLARDLVEDLGVGVERALRRRDGFVDLVRRRQLCQRLEGQRRRRRVQPEGTLPGGVVGRQELPAGDAHRELAGLNVLHPADQRVVEARARLDDHRLGGRLERLAALEEIATAGFYLVADRGELREVLLDLGELGGRRRDELPLLVRRGEGRRLSQQPGRPRRAVGELLDRLLPAAGLVFERRPPHRLDDAIDLEIARDPGTRGDEPVDLTAERGELPDAEQRDQRAERDDRAEPEMDPRPDPIVAEAHGGRLFHGRRAATQSLMEGLIAAYRSAARSLDSVYFSRADKA